MTGLIAIDQKVEAFPGTNTNQSFYLTMRDGTKIAVDLWLPSGINFFSKKLPTIISATRYWRSKDWLPTTLASDIAPPDRPRYWNRNGYAMVLIDARGTGASFGSRDYPFSPDEIDDYGEIIDWIVSPQWSNGNVAGWGISYDGDTAEWMVSTGRQAIKAVIPQYSDFDLFEHNFAPGGIFNDGFTKAWSANNVLLDTNDVCAI